MAKKEYVSAIDTVSDQLYRLFSHYFSRGWISEGEIYCDHDMRQNGGLNFMQLRTLLRTECIRRGVPLVFLYQNYSPPDQEPGWRIRVRESAQTRSFLLSMMLMGNVRWTGLGAGEQLVPRLMQRALINGQDTMDAVYALLEQQPFIQKARAIGAEHYPAK